MSLAVAEALGRDSLPELDPDAPAADVIQLAFSVADQRIRQLDPQARRGEVDGVHQMRTATRRLRSELKLYRDLLDGDSWEGVDDELQWLGRLLGVVRDTDVMGNRLRRSAAELAVDLGPLFRALGERHAAALTALGEAMESDRYRSLLDLLAETAERPSVRGDAWEPAGRALPPLARKSWKRLRSAARALDLVDADEDYHEVRKRARQARYDAESVVPGLGPGDAVDARRFARRARKVQDVLGEHQDAVIATHEIRGIAAEHCGNGVFNLAAGRLLERQTLAASAARTDYFKIWQKLDRKKNERWMTR